MDPDQINIESQNQLMEMEPTLSDLPTSAPAAIETYSKIAKILDSTMDSSTIALDYPGLQNIPIQNSVKKVNDAFVYAEPGWESVKNLSFKYNSQFNASILPSSVIINLPVRITFDDNTRITYNNTNQPNWFPVNDFFNRFFNQKTLTNDDGTMTAPVLSQTYPAELFTRQFQILKSHCNLYTANTFFYPERRTNTSILPAENTVSDDNEKKRIVLMKDSVLRDTVLEIPASFFLDYFKSTTPIMDTKTFTLSLNSTSDVKSLFRQIQTGDAVPANAPNLKFFAQPYLTFATVNFTQQYLAPLQKLLSKGIFYRSSTNDYFTGQTATIPQNGVRCSLNLSNGSLTNDFLIIQVLDQDTAIHREKRHADLKEFASGLIGNLSVSGVVKTDETNFLYYDLNNHKDSTILYNYFLSYITGKKCSKITPASFFEYDFQNNIPNKRQYYNGLFKVLPTEVPAGAVTKDNREYFPIVVDLRAAAGTVSKMEKTVTSEPISITFQLRSQAYGNLDVRATLVSSTQNGYVMKSGEIHSVFSLNLPNNEKE